MSCTPTPPPTPRVGAGLRACSHVAFLRRTLPCEETVGVAPSELPEGADPRVQELKSRLEQELKQQGEEQYLSVLKRKEQHVTEVWDRAAAKPTPPARPKAAG